MSAAIETVRDRVASSAGLSGWAVFAIDDLFFALPQREVRTIDLVANLKPSVPGGRHAVIGSASGDIQGAVEKGRAIGHEIGWLLPERGDAWPVYSFDRRLCPQKWAPQARRLCVLVAADGKVTGIACDRLELLEADDALSAEPVPGCMTGVPSPITGYARYQSGIVSVLNAASLHAYLALIVGHGHDADE